MKTKPNCLFENVRVKNNCRGNSNHLLRIQAVTLSRIVNLGRKCHIRFQKFVSGAMKKMQFSRGHRYLASIEVHFIPFFIELPERIATTVKVHHSFTTTCFWRSCFYRFSHFHRSGCLTNHSGLPSECLI